MQVKNLIFLLCCFYILPTQALDFWKDNTNPKRGVLGVIVGGGLLFGGNGEVFEDPQDVPHGEFTLNLGIDYWWAVHQNFNLYFSVLSNYHQAHFHQSINTVSYDGYYRQLFISLPIAIEYPIPKYPYLALRAGVAASFDNVWGKTAGDLIGFNYSTSVQHDWLISPDLFVGINFLEEELPKFNVKAMIQYAFFPFSGMQQNTNLSFIPDDLSHEGAMNSERLQLLFVLYPKWKIKSKVGDNSNCPAF